MGDLSESVPLVTKTPAEIRAKLIGVFCALIVVVLFAGFTLVSRLGFTTSLGLIDIAALRFGIGGMLLLPIFVKYGFSGVRWQQAVILALLGGLGFALFAYTGFLLAPASHGSVLLHGTLSLFTFAIVYSSTRQTVKRGQVAGLFLVALGIVAMAWDSLSSATVRQLMGDLSLLLASLCWSTYGVVVRRLGLAPARAAAIVAVLSMCCFIPIYLALPGKMLLSAGWHELLLQGVFQGALLGAFSIFIYTRAVVLLGAAETALFTAAVPCLTTILAIPLLSEFPSLAAVVGVAMVTIGMVVSMRNA